MTSLTPKELATPVTAPEIAQVVEQFRTAGLPVFTNIVRRMAWELDTARPDVHRWRTWKKAANNMKWRDLEPELPRPEDEKYVTSQTLDNAIDNLIIEQKGNH